MITNLRYTEKLLSGKEAIKEFYGFDGEHADRVVDKIERACILAGKSLDINLGHFGDVALDFILDRKGSIYFLEANSNYGHASFEKIRDIELRNCVFKSPMEYAKTPYRISDKRGDMKECSDRLFLLPQLGMQMKNLI